MYQKIKTLFVPQTRLKASIILVLNCAAIIFMMTCAQIGCGKLAIILCAMLLATRLKCLNNIIHECHHNSFSNNAKYNHFVGRILSIVLLTDYRYYRKEHNSHHKYLGNYDKDMDFQPRKLLKYEAPFTWEKVVLDIFCLRFICFYFPHISIRNKDHVIGVIFYSLLFFVLSWNEYYQVSLTLLFSIFIFLPLVRYFIDIVDHGGLYNSETNEIHKSRNFIIKNLILRELLFPRNDCYHLVHHLYPYLPVYNLDKAHNILLNDDEYKNLKHNSFNIKNVLL